MLLITSVPSTHESVQQMMGPSYCVNVKTIHVTQLFKLYSLCKSIFNTLNEQFSMKFKYDTRTKQQYSTELLTFHSSTNHEINQQSSCRMCNHWIQDCCVCTCHLVTQIVSRVYVQCPVLEPTLLILMHYLQSPSMIKWQICESDQLKFN